MKKTFASILALQLIVTASVFTTASAQIKNYNFNQSSTSYSAITDGYILVPADNITAADDELYQLIDIGFDFTFNGIVYNSFGISSNGFIWFGMGVPDALTYDPLSNSSAELNGIPTIEGIISPLANDLLKRMDAPLGEIMVRTTGDAPGRVCTIQFSNWSSVSGGANTVYNFQIKLYETTNQIAFVYNGFNTDVFVSGFQVGLRGFDNSDFKNASGTNVNWAGVATGSNNSSGSIVSSTVLPANGTTFLWTPGASSLPLNFLQFTIDAKAESNILSWATSNENGVKEFIIERSNNSKNYQAIGKVNAKNLNALNNYQFKDQDPGIGVNYYRIKTFTSDGENKITAVKMVRNSRVNAAKLYPNPAQASVTIEFASAIKDHAVVYICSVNGNIVYQQNNYPITKGENRLNVSTQRLSKGAYVVKILLQNSVMVKQFIKQ